MERGKPENPEKNPRSRDEKQQQTQPTYDAGSGNRTRATLVGGERPHHCTMLANLRDLHERREGGRQGAAGHVLRWPGRARACLRARKSEAAHHDQPPVPGRDHLVPADKAAVAGVLLRFSGSIFPSQRFRADPDRHRLQLPRHFGRPAWGYRSPKIAGGIWGKKDRMASLGEVDWPHAGPVQTQMWRQPDDRVLFEVLLCWWTRQRKKRFITKGMSQRQNKITWQRFKAALKGSTDRAENRGLRILNGRVVTYEQHKLGLSTCYDKG